jgi:proteasome assembly chaperone (PAC2) family protein
MDGFSIEPVTGLRSPIIVMAFTGWSDSGSVSTDAAEQIIEAFNGERFLWVDPEDYYVFTDTRPHVRLVDGGVRTIQWPDNGAWAVRLPDAEHDLIVVTGVEPNLRWRTFSERLTEALLDLDPSLGCTIGSRPAPVPHTRPVPVNGSSTDPRLAAKYGLGASRYEGPTGIVGVVHDYLREGGVGLISIFANVPHYLSIDENPLASLALLDALRPVIGTEVPPGSIAEDAEHFVDRVNEASGDNEQVQEYVRMLEQQYGYYEPPPEAEGNELPPAADILKDVEDLLRGSGDD